MFDFPDGFDATPADKSRRDDFFDAVCKLLYKAHEAGITLAKVPLDLLAFALDRVEALQWKNIAQAILDTQPEARELIKFNEERYPGFIINLVNNPASAAVVHSCK